jgi:hypothetical protein
MMDSGSSRPSAMSGLVLAPEPVAATSAQTLAWCDMRKLYLAMTILVLSATRATASDSLAEAPSEATPQEAPASLVELGGRVKEFASGNDLDTPRTLSPDGRTVVFVSDRTSVASFFRTTVDGEEPVQLTNTGLSAELLSQGVPEDFVPPPVFPYTLEWVDDDVLRYDAGGGEFWMLNVRTGEASPDLGGDE